MNMYCICHYTLLSLLCKCVALCGSCVAHFSLVFVTIAPQRLPPFGAFFVLRINNLKTAL